MVQHLFRQKTGLDHQAAHLGSEHDIGVARAERQDLPGKPEEEARSAADLARHHARLYDIAAFRPETAETLETVEIVLFLAARGGGIVVFAAHGSAAHQGDAADADHVASLEGLGQGGFHGVQDGAGALPSHRALVGRRRSAARRSAAISAPAPHAADTRNADAADTRNADAAAAPPAAGVSAATSGVSAAGVSAATRVSAAT